MEQTVKNLVQLAMEMGADAADAIISERLGVDVNIFEGAVDAFSNSHTRGVGLRVIKNERVGYAYTEKADEADERLVRAALASAAVSDPVKGADVYRGEGVTCRAEEPTMPNAEKVTDKALKLYEALIKHKIDSVQACEVEQRVTRRAFANSAGIVCSSMEQRAEMAAEPVVREGDWTDNNYDIAIAYTLEELDEQAVAEKSVEKAWQYHGAVPGRTGKMPVVLSGLSMARLLSSMESAFSAEQAEKGLSLLRGREGEQIAAPLITLVDDPVHPQHGFTRLFDSEGVPARKKNVIDAGVLTTLLHSVASANRAGVAPTGNAMRGYAGAVSIGVQNFYLVPGAETAQALYEQAGAGVIVQEVSGLHAGVNATSGDFSLLGKGFLIENGQKGAPIAQMVVSGNFFRLLEQVQTLGNDLEFISGGYGSPSVLVQGLTIAAGA